VKKTAKRLIYVLIALSVVLLGSFSLVPFLRHVTLDNVAVYRGISLAPGTVKQSFRPNYSGYYSMGIEVERKFPHEVLQCLMGITGPELLDPATCKENPAALQYAWSLTCNGRLVQVGSSDKIVGRAYTRDTMEAEFGSFPGRRGDRCQLTLRFLRDGRKLAVADPKLHIYIELIVKSVPPQAFTATPGKRRSRPCGCWEGLFRLRQIRQVKLNR
jgi:hypothetical protein